MISFSFIQKRFVITLAIVATIGGSITFFEVVLIVNRIAFIHRLFVIFLVFFDYIKRSNSTKKLALLAKFGIMPYSKI